MRKRDELDFGFTLESYRPVAILILLVIAAISVIAFFARSISATLHELLDSWGLGYLGLAALIILLPFIRAFGVSKDGVRGEFSPLLEGPKNIPLVAESIIEEAESVTRDSGHGFVAEGADHQTERVAEVETTGIEDETAKTPPTANAIRDISATPDDFLFVKLSTEIEKRLYAAAVAGGLTPSPRGGASKLITMLASGGIISEGDAEKLRTIVRMRNQQAHGHSSDRESAVAFTRQEAGQLLISLDSLKLIARHDLALRLLAEKAGTAGLSIVRDQVVGQRRVDLLIGGDILTEVVASDAPTLIAVRRGGAQLRLASRQLPKGRPLLVVASGSAPSAGTIDSMTAEFPGLPLAWLDGLAFDGTTIARRDFPWIFSA